MNTPTPRTDAATYPADCLGQTLVTNRDLASTLERELTAITAERDQLRADCENETKWAAHYLAQSIADKARAERAEAMLADPQQLHAHCLRTLNEGQIAHLFGGRMTEIVNRAERAEAVAAMKEDAK